MEMYIYRGQNKEKVVRRLFRLTSVPSLGVTTRDLSPWEQTRGSRNQTPSFVSTVGKRSKEWRPCLKVNDIGFFPTFWNSEFFFRGSFKVRRRRECLVSTRLGLVKRTKESSSLEWSWEFSSLWFLLNPKTWISDNSRRDGRGSGDLTGCQKR